MVLRLSGCNLATSVAPRQREFFSFYSNRYLDLPSDVEFIKKNNRKPTRISGRGQTMKKIRYLHTDDGDLSEETLRF